VGWQMLLGGLVSVAVALAIGEGTQLAPGAFSTRSLLAFGYLVVFGSWVAFTAYAWLLQNAPLGQVATYAYVKPRCSPPRSSGRASPSTRSASPPPSCSRA